MNKKVILILVAISNPGSRFIKTSCKSKNSIFSCLCYAGLMRYEVQIVVFHHLVSVLSLLELHHFASVGGPFGSFGSFHLAILEASSSQGPYFAQHSALGCLKVSLEVSSYRIRQLQGSVGFAAGPRCLAVLPAGLHY